MKNIRRGFQKFDCHSTLEKSKKIEYFRYSFIVFVINLLYIEVVGTGLGLCAGFVSFAWIDFDVVYVALTFYVVYLLCGFE